MFQLCSTRGEVHDVVKAFNQHPLIGAAAIDCPAAEDAIVLSNVKKFLSKLGKSDNAMKLTRAVLAAISGPGISARAVARATGVTRYQMGRSATAFLEAPESNIVVYQQKRQVRSDAVRPDMIAMVRDWLHSDEASCLDNTRPKDYLIPTGEVDRDGRRIFMEHPARYTRGTAKELWAQFQQSPVWEKVQERYNGGPSRRAAVGLAGGEWLVRAAWCKCLGKKHPNQCVCPICTDFIETLRVIDHNRATWRAVATCQCRDDGGDDCLCDSGAWADFTSDRHAALSTLLCDKKTLLQRDGAPLLFADYNAETATFGPATSTLAIRQKACHNCANPLENRKKKLLHCASCGWNQTFGQMPSIDCVDSTDGSIHATTTALRGCPRELSTDSMTWARFLNVPCGFTTEGKPKTRVEWSPQHGTRQACFVFLKDSFERYRRHLWDVKWNFITLERIKQARLLIPASLGLDSQFWLSDHDFASQLEGIKSQTTTCAWPLACNCFSGVVGAAPMRIPTSGLGHTVAQEAVAPDSGGTPTVVKGRVASTHKIVLDTHVYFAYSAAKTSATYQFVAQQIMYESMVSGVLPPRFRGFGIEIFRDGHLLIGCDFDELPPELKCATTAMPLAKVPETIADWYDGCGDQYAGLNGLYAKQLSFHQLSSTPAFEAAKAGVVHQPVDADDVAHHPEHSHALVKSKTIDLHFTCDVCNVSYPVGSQRYHCSHNCDWDACMSCVASSVAVARPSPSSDGAAAVAFTAAPPVYHYQHRHQLTRCDADDGHFFTCDSCNGVEMTVSESQRYRCDDCDWDCCGLCFAKSQSGFYLPSLAVWFSTSAMNCAEARPSQRPPPVPLRRCDVGEFTCSGCGWYGICAATTPVHQFVRDGKVEWVGCMVCAMNPAVALREFYDRHYLGDRIDISSVIERVGASRMKLGWALQHMSKQRGLHACPGHRRAARHGKALPDGFGKKPKSVIAAASCSDGIPVASNVRGLVRYLASKMFGKHREDRGSASYKLWTEDTMTHIYIPEAALEAFRVQASSGFSGSKLFHYYNGVADGKALNVRQSWCCCHACTASPTLLSSKCCLQRVVGASTTRYLTALGPALNAHDSGAPARQRRVFPRSNSDDDYAQLCKLGQNVLLLVHPEDELHGEEPYFVARVVTEAWKHSHGNFEGQPFDPGTWLTRVTWFARIRDDPSLGFLCKIQSGFHHVTPVSGLLRVNFNYGEVKMQWDQKNGWWLKHSLHAKLMARASFEEE